MRLVPFSYFCTCWNVSPKAPPSFSWLIDSIIRRMRTRLPTCLSMGFGVFLTITFSYGTSTERNGIPAIFMSSAEGLGYVAFSRPVYGDAGAPGAAIRYKYC